MITKKSLGIIGVSSLLVGGVSAYILLDKSPKEAYLYAEYKTGKEMVEFFTDRYEEELTWSEKTKTKPTKNELDLSASIEDYNYNFSPEIIDAINSSSINLVVESDPKEKQMAMGLGATLLDYDIDKFTLYTTDKSAMLELPFHDEVLSVAHEDLVDMIEGETGESICLNGEDLANILTNQQVLTEDDMNYLKKEYGKLLVDVLPDDAFVRKDNTITMSLSGSDIEDILVKISDFAKNDKELVRMLEKAVHYSDPCGEINIKDELDQFFAEIEKIEVNGKFVSKIWLEKNIITKRSIEMDTLKIEGEQSIGDKLVFDYEFIDELNDDTLTIDGEFNSGESIKDSLTIEANDVTLTYNSEESINKDKRKFERQFGMSDYATELSLNWDGDYSISGDQLSGEHSIYMEIPETGKIGLAIKNKSAITKKINIPSKTKDLGKMSMSEIQEYIELEVAPNAQKWGEGLFEELADLLYYY